MQKAVYCTKCFDMNYLNWSLCQKLGAYVINEEPEMKEGLNVSGPCALTYMRFGAETKPHPHFLTPDFSVRFQLLSRGL